MFQGGEYLGQPLGDAFQLWHLSLETFVPRSVLTRRRPLRRRRLPRLIQPAQYLPLGIQTGKIQVGDQGPLLRILYAVTQVGGQLRGACPAKSRRIAGSDPRPV